MLRYYQSVPDATRTRVLPDQTCVVPHNMRSSTEQQTNVMPATVCTRFRCSRVFTTAMAR